MSGWYGQWYGDPGVTLQPSSPALALATTAESIRDRIIAVIVALTPSLLASDLYVEYRNELGADFRDWCEDNPAAALRKFQVRRIADASPAEVSNSDHEERIVSFRVLVAYPQTHRYGGDNASDRDDVMDADQMKIDYAIGMCGRANLAPPYPDACWRGSGNGETSGIRARIEGDDVDFVEIVVSYAYQRTMT